MCTVNQAELKAILNSLRKLKEPCNVSVYSDSGYAVGVLSGRCKWEANGDLIYQVSHAANEHEVTYNWIRKNSNSYNSRAHRLAKIAAMKVSICTAEEVRNDKVYKEFLEVGIQQCLELL